MFRLMITPLYHLVGEMPTSSIMQQVKHIHIDKLLSLLTFPRKPFRNRSINRERLCERRKLSIPLRQTLSAFMQIIELYRHDYFLNFVWLYTKGLISQRKESPSDVVAWKGAMFLWSMTVTYSQPKSKQELLTDKYLSNSTPVRCNLPSIRVSVNWGIVRPINSQEVIISQTACFPSL